MPQPTPFQGVGHDDRNERSRSPKYAQLRQQAAQWFESQWAGATSVTNEDLAKAAVAWEAGRKDRPEARAGESFLAQPAQALKDRPVYFAVYRSFASPQAAAALNDKKQALSDEGGRDVLASGLEVFEGWAPGEIPSDPDSSLIQIYWGRRGKIAVFDVLRPVPGLLGSYLDQEDGEAVCPGQVISHTSIGCVIAD